MIQDIYVTIQIRICLTLKQEVCGWYKPEPMSLGIIKATRGLSCVWWKSNS